MKLKNLAVFCTISLSATAQNARADLGYWSAALVGFWNHPTNGDVYHFYSDATYTFYKFRPNTKKESNVNISHSGWWKIYDPGRKIVPGLEGPVGLLLKARTREVLRNGQHRTLKTNRTFRLLLNTPPNEASKRGQSYIIDGVSWSLVGVPSRAR